MEPLPSKAIDLPGGNSPEAARIVMLGDTVIGDTDSFKLAGLRRYAQFLDSAIPLPGTNIRIGFDAIFGIFPGIGDMIGAALSFYIVYAGALLGLRRRTLAHMCGNILVDSAIGAIPFLGDLFDVSWKANLKNVSLIESAIGAGKFQPRTPERVGRMGRNVITGAIIVIMVFTAFAIALVIALLMKLLS